MLRCSSRSKESPAVRRGFSLFELLLVVGIMAGLIGLSAPAILKWQNRLEVDRAIYTVQSLCAETRMKSIQLGRPIEVVLINENTLRQSIAEDQSVSNKSDVRLPGGYAVRPIQNVRESLQNNQRTRSSVRFFPDGTAEPVTLMLSDKHQQAQASLKMNTLTGALIVQAGLK